ncbi:MAG: DNA-formamidopyrimidine glycosylase, partial [Micavibrio sp.]|nr:DNA-formamidopyrimidine glycosylase [Micavibrio sp.]
MPELPEVEIVKRGLDPVMRSQVINECEIFRSNLRYPFPPDFCEVLRGAKVESLCRRGKYLLIYLSNGYGLIWHLGMSGSVKIFPAKQSYPSFERVKHDHVVI